MQTLLMLMPVYVLGNLHCAGMCGPLVLLLGSHRYRWFYFLGRLLSFTLSGLLAGLFGSVIQLFGNAYHLSAWITFSFGIGLLCFALFSFVPQDKLPRIKFPEFFSGIERHIARLMLADRRWPIFFFGFLTIFLPCGQTLLVYSTLAIEGEMWSGLLNGAIFALMTSPSLIVAMHAGAWMSRFKGYYRPMIGVIALSIAMFMIYRGITQVI